MKKVILSGLVVLALGLGFTGCRDAAVVSHNLSQDADNFKLDRRVIFYNGITGSYMFTIEGKCSIYDQGNQLEVTCKTGDEKFKKHFLGLSDNVTYFVEQLESRGVSRYHYKVVFKPQAIIPDVDFRGSTADLPRIDHDD